MFLVLPFALSCSEPMADPSCAQGQCDGVGDFSFIYKDISYPGAPVELSLNVSMHTTTVVLVADKESQTLTMNAVDHRLVVPATQSVHITNIATDFDGWAATAGLSVQMREVGTQTWLAVGGNTYWKDVTLNAAQTTAEGTSIFCLGRDCYNSDDTVYIPWVSEEKMVEYRLTLLPVYDWYNFDTGPYDITFDVLDK